METISSQNLDQLRSAVRQKFNSRLKTPKDFAILSESIYESIHQRISPTTLKRMWGYLSESTTPRTATLDILAQYCGYVDLQDFVSSLTRQNATHPQSSVTTSSSAKSAFLKKFFLSHRTIIAVVSLLVVAAIGIFYFIFPPHTFSPSIVISRGQRFATSADYLSLFDIEAEGRVWAKELPGHHGVTIWGPAYHHPNWHNDGNADLLFPTITEYYTLPDTTHSSQLVVRQRNIDQYYNFIRFDELRVCFMKNIVDTGFVFLGVYRLSRTQSDTTHLVWERVTDRVDLNNLDELDEFHHAEPVTF